MRKFSISLFTRLLMVAAAQTTSAPEQESEQIQRQLEEAKAASERAKVNAVKAKTEAEARARKEAEDKAKAEDIEKKIVDMKAETERLPCEAEALSEAANEVQTTTATPATKVAATITKAVSNAPSDAWVALTTPVTAAVRTNKNVSADSKVDKDICLQKGIILEANGQVVWTETFNIPGATTDELYGKAFAYLTELIQDDNQLGGSKVALMNKGEHGIVATIHEKLTFSSSFLSLDYAQFNYVFQATCRDGQATLTMDHLIYRYDVQGNVSNLSAEQWITDKYAVSKKQTRLLPVPDRSRRTTVDRKNSIFKGFAQALK